MISFAGFDLTLDSKYRHLQQYWESVGHDAIPQSVTERFNAVGQPSPVGFKYSALPEIGVNQLFWPTGYDRPAIGHFLISKDVYDALVMGGANHGNLSIDTGGGVVRLPYPMRVVALTPLHIVKSYAEEYPLYLLTLSDVRWRAWTEANNTPDLQGHNIFSTVWGDLGLSDDYTITQNPSDSTVLNLASYSLSAKWNGIPASVPVPLIADAIAEAYGKRWVFPFDFVANGHDVWTQEKDDTLWESVKDRVVAGGRLTKDQVNRGLPSNYIVKFSGGEEIPYTLSALLGETSVGNGQTVYIWADPEKSTGHADSDFTLKLARNWVANHRGTFDGTVNGIVPLALHAGIDYVLVTHRVDQCNMRVVRWGKFYHPNFSYSQPFNTYALNATLSGTGPFSHLYDSTAFTFTFPSSGTGSTPLELKLPGPGLYEIDLRIQAELTSVPADGYVYFDLLVYDEGGDAREIGPQTGGQKVICQSLLTSSPPGPTIYTKIPGSYSLRWLEQLPGSAPFAGVGGNEIPTLKLIFYSQAGACTIAGTCSLTVTRSPLRTNAG